MEAIVTISSNNDTGIKLIPEKCEFFDNKFSGYFKGMFDNGSEFHFDFITQSELNKFRRFFNKNKYEVMRQFICKHCDKKYLPSLTQLEDYYTGNIEKPDECQECKDKKSKEKPISNIK